MSPDFEQLDSRNRVVTPENIAFEYRVAGPFSRLGAYLLDIALQFVVVLLSFIGLMLLAGLLAYALQTSTISIGEVIANLGIFATLVLWFLLQWFYGALFEIWWNGQTPGKRLLGLRTLQVDGRPINGRQALLRNLIRLLDAQPFVPAPDFLLVIMPQLLGSHLLGLTAMTFSPRQQRLGDLACGTMVIAEERSIAGSVEPINDPAVGQLLEEIPASFMPSRSLSKALSHYIGRRRYFGPARRQEIAKHVGAVLIERLNLPPTTDCDLLLCALYQRAFSDDAFGLDTPRPTAQPTQPAPTPGLSPVPTSTASQPTAATSSAGKDESETDWESVPLG